MNPDPRLASMIRRLRDARGWSLRRLGATVHVSHAHLHDIEHARKQPSPQLLQLLDDALGASGALLRLSSCRMQHVAARPATVDRATVDALAVVLAGLRRLEDAAGPAAALAGVDSQWPLITAITRDACGPIRRAAVDLAGQWAQFAGWLALASGDHRGAAAAWDQALDHATEVGDRDLIATVLSFRGHAAWLRGELGPAVGLTEAALRDPEIYVGQRAYDRYQLARALAATGDQRAARDALARGVDLAAEMEEHHGERPPWHYYRTPGFFDLEAALVWGQLGDQGQAEVALERGLAGLPPDQRQAEWLQQYLNAASPGGS